MSAVHTRQRTLNDYAIAAIFMLLMCSSASAQKDTPTTQADVPDSPDKFHLFLLVGQSNMAGRGKVEEQDRQTHPRILTLTKNGGWALAKDPLHFDKPNIVGVGLGKTFALDYIAAHPDITVGLIPCAVGGSPIATWDEGGYHPSTKTHPWDDMLPRAQLAMKSGTLKGILWHQGEGDSNEKKAPLYEKKFHNLIARLRGELHVPKIPFVAGQMGQFAERPWNKWKKMVDAVHRNLSKNVAHTAFVSSDGLNHKGDKVHFDSAGYRTLGHRYYTAYQSLVQPAKTAE